MSKEKQIEELLNELIRTNGYGTLNAVANHLYNAGYRKIEWISVEDALPKPYESVIYYGRETTGFDYMTDDGKWRISTGADPDEVTHWMPLPEPPKMKGGE